MTADDAKDDTDMPTSVEDTVVVAATPKPKPRVKRGPKTLMSDDHKEALAVGRAEGRAVRAYLEALDAHAPKRGRRRTPESIGARLARIEDELPGADPLGRLNLAQEKIDLQAELAVMADGGVDMGVLAAGFVEVAKGYADRRGISYAAFRMSGVPAAVLKQAGITRGA
jgi:hypothetical protein